jgi:hypothetical protein
MARIQVLPLTPRTLGRATETPFVIVIDQVDGERTWVGEEVWTEVAAARIKAETGAVLVLLSDGELTVANVDEELHQAARAAAARALAPVDGDLSPDELWDRLQRLSDPERTEWLSILLKDHRTAGACFVENHSGLRAELELARSSRTG